MVFPFCEEKTNNWAPGQAIRNANSSFLPRPSLACSPLPTSSLASCLVLGSFSSASASAAASPAASAPSLSFVWLLLYIVVSSCLLWASPSPLFSLLLLLQLPIHWLCCNPRACTIYTHIVIVMRPSLRLLPPFPLTWACTQYCRRISLRDRALAHASKLECLLLLCFSSCK